MSAETLPAQPAAETRAPRGLSRLLTWALVGLVGAVLVDALFEGWVEALVGTTSVGYAGRIILHEAAWPKLIKNVLVLALAGGTVVKVALDRRWRDFTTPADIAVAVLGVVLVLAGLVNGSGPSLIGQALYVYLRGAIVFYALRAAAPSWRHLRPVLLAVGGVVALNVAMALVQMVAGPPVYRAFGWVDLTWANTSRAHGMLNHPNHLGHVLALATLGLLAWTRTRARLGWRPWAALVALTLALSASQSRESIIALCTTTAALWLLRGITLRRAAAAVALLVVFTGAQIALRPDNRAEWQKRLNGVAAALRFPTGDEGVRGASPSAPPATPSPSKPSPSKPAPSPSAPSKAAPADPAPSKSKRTKKHRKPKRSRSASPKPTPSVSPTRSAPATAAVPSPTPTPSPTATYVPPREIRVLYFHQGVRLIERRPVLGYGVGKFGGIVAEKNNPDWNLNPAFGPEGFDRHGFQAKQVDSFWLHLVVEAGVLGLLAYLGWLAMLARPLLRRTERFRGTRPPGGPYVYWGLAALVFVFQAAFLSESLEDPILPALFFGILALGWLFPGRDAEVAAS